MPWNNNNAVVSKSTRMHMPMSQNHCDKIRKEPWEKKKRWEGIHHRSYLQLLFGSLLYFLALLLVFFLDPATRRKKHMPYKISTLELNNSIHYEYNWLLKLIEQRDGWSVWFATLWQREGWFISLRHLSSPIFLCMLAGLRCPHRKDEQTGNVDRDIVEHFGQRERWKHKSPSKYDTTYRASCLHLNKLGVSTFGCVSSSSSEICWK